MSTDYKLEPKPSDDFPSISENDAPNFDFLKNLDEGLDKSADKGDDFSFGGSPEEIKQALKRNEELVSDGFDLKQADNEALKPKVYGSDGKEVEVDTPIQNRDLTNYSVGVAPNKSSTFIPKSIPKSIPKNEDSYWRELYYKQKAIITTLEKIIEDLQPKD